MPSLGKKYACYSCHTKFYDLGKPAPLCPKCGADQRDAEEAPATTSHRGRRVIEEPVDEFESDEEEITPPAADVEEDEEFAPPAAVEEEEEEEEEY